MADSFTISPQGFAMLRRIKADPMFNPSEGEERKLVLYLHRAGLITDFIPSHGRRLTPEGEEALRLEDERLAAEEKAAEEKARDQAQHAEQARSERAQVLSDKEKDYRHDFKVAAFSVGLALLAEHLGDIIDFIKVTIEKILTLLGLLH